MSTTRSHSVLISLSGGIYKILSSHSSWDSVSRATILITNYQTDISMLKSFI